MHGHDRLPEITWRAGLDLNPLDVTSDDDVRWLSCLVWPGEGDREQRLAAAIASARGDPPVVHRGDMLTGLPALAAQAPAEAALVVYHSAVLAYLTPAGQRRFAATVGALPAVWLSNEGPAVLSGVPVPACQGAPFVLARDGHTPIALPTRTEHGCNGSPSPSDANQPMSWCLSVQPTGLASGDRGMCGPLLSPLLLEYESDQYLAGFAC